MSLIAVELTAVFLLVCLRGKFVENVLNRSVLLRLMHFISSSIFLNFIYCFVLMPVIFILRMIWRYSCIALGVRLLIMSHEFDSC